MSFINKTYGIAVDFNLIENVKPKDAGKLSKKYSKKFKLKRKPNVQGGENDDQ